MKPRHYLRCLGQPALFTPTGELVRIRTKKHLALLVYLAVESRRPHRREDLAALLWPKAKSAEARHSLSTALSLFRARLGREAVEAGREKVGLKTGQLTLDIDQLIYQETGVDKETAPTLLTGFLEGFDIADAPDFEHWKDRKQAQLLPLIKRRLISSIESHYKENEFLEGEALADRLLALDELCEEAIRVKMETRLQCGDRITALRIYEEWKAKLANELHAEPSANLQQIAVRARRPGWNINTPQNSVHQSSQERPKLFIGRSSEYATLDEQWQKTSRGTVSHTLLLGDSGIGKTALAQQLINTITLSGGAAVRVQCHDVEQQIPYSALSSLTLHLLDLPGAASTSPDALIELASTSSEIRKRYPSLPSPRSDSGESARIRLAESFIDLLLAIADNQPLILVVDDVHYADDASLAALHLAMQRTPGQPIMMLFIGRPGDLSVCPQAARLRDSTAAPNLKEINVGALSQNESQSLLNSLIARCPQQPNVSTQRAILRASGGYPMALELLAQDWEANRDQCVALSINAMTEEAALAEGTTIATYSRLFRSITRMLTPHAKSALSMAAILGGRLNDIEAYELVGLTPRETNTALAELIKRHLLRDNGRQLEFINELVRTASYIETPPSTRKHLHSAIADRIIDTQRDSPEQVDIEIAWHCLRSRRQSEAIAPLVRGARKAMQCGAPYLAEQALTTALPILKEPQKGDAMLLLSEAVQEQARWEDSLAILAALTITESREQADLKYILELTARKRLRQYEGPEQLTEFVRQIIHFIYTSKHSPSRLRAAIEGASALHVIRSSALTKQFLAATGQIPAEALSSHGHAQLLLAQAMGLFNLGDFLESINHIEHGISILQSANIVDSTLAMFQSGLGSIYSLLGNYTESVTQLLAAASTATRIDNRRIHNLAGANLSVAYNRLGEYKESIRWAEQTASYVHEVYSAAPQGALCSYAMLHDANGVSTTIEHWTPTLRRHYSSGVIQGWNLLCADAHLMLGHRKQAESYAQEAIGDEPIGPETDFCAGAYARWTAQLGFRNREIEKAVRLIEKLHSRLAYYHRMDQVEILVARVWLANRQTGHLRHQDQESVKWRLNELPRGIRDQLDRLGMLDWLGKAEADC